MDASTHADKKGARKEEHRVRDAMKDKGAEGRYEGGNDSDQSRQAGKGRDIGQGEGVFPPPMPTPPGSGEEE
jgi:hypothetical protein